MRRPLAALALLGAAFVAGCRQDMHDAPSYDPYEKSDFFPDGRSARPPVAGTVARGQLREDAAFYTGRAGAAFVASVPLPVDGAVLKRGRERYSIYCTPCHGQSGEGDGLVVQRGFRRPPSFHVDRLRAQPDGYLYDVITSGFGTMPDYAAQVGPRDRWAIVAYVRALQLSQNATVSDVPPERRGELDRAPLPSGAAPTVPSSGVAPADSRYGPRPPAGPSPVPGPGHRR